MEINQQLSERAVMASAKKQLLYWSMASIVIFFGAFCSYYLVMHGNSNWLTFNLPSMFYVSTAIIVLSSATMYWAQQSAKNNNTSSIKLAMFITLLLGVAFCVSQIQAWKDLYSHGIVFAGKQSSIAGGILYVITSMHFLHIVAGIVVLFITWTNSLKGRYTAENQLGLNLCGIFWHFLDILWVILFLFLYLFR